MGLGTWISDFFLGNPEKGVEAAPIDVDTQKRIQVACYQYLAVNTCINYIASIISLADFQTYSDGEMVKSLESYRFNVEPNKNTASTAFWRRVVQKLVENNECLVVKINTEYYVAESYQRKENVIAQNEYTNVVIGESNQQTIKGKFYEKDVFFFEWNNLGLMQYVKNVYGDIGRLIGAASENYLRLSNTKVLIKQSASSPATKEFNDAVQALVNANLKEFLDPSKSNALPLRKGVEYEDVSRTSNASSTNAATEIKTLIQEGISLTAMAFQISPQLLIGDIAGIADAYRLTMTTCIKPIVNIISDEINRKLYGYKEYQRGRRMFIDVSNVSYTDIKDVANALEVLTRIRANTLDDNLRILGREPVGGAAGAMRLVTKNYVSDEWLESDEAKGVKE
ncbi:MAG: phage portal protein [Peptococcaceae bacterium]|nr:phage portal protein [Peptococcaceae bacterium]